MFSLAGTIDCQAMVKLMAGQTFSRSLPLVVYLKPGHPISSKPIYLKRQILNLSTGTLDHLSLIQVINPVGRR